MPPLLPPTLAVPDAVLRGSGDGATRRPATDAAL
ncbi:Uncharacterised protein [Mycobacteroides abscessus]|nr:Uncharacterised protein [Mycobacteroides abscessus]